MRTLEGSTTDYNNSFSGIRSHGTGPTQSSKQLSY